MRTVLPLLALLLPGCIDQWFSRLGEDSAPSPGPPADTGDPVEPASCDDHEPPAPYDPDRDETCSFEVPPGAFDPVVEWRWDTNPVYPGYTQVISTPAVANLTDDDGDGKIDEADVPDIVFTSFMGDIGMGPGALTVLSGDDGRTLWSDTRFGGFHPQGTGGVAVADLEGDGSPDILVAGVERPVLAVEADGSLKWSSEAGWTTATGHPSVADLDGDGCAEVVLGPEVFDCTGRRLWEGSAGHGRYMSFAVDMDGDGQLEVVAGSTVYDTDGSILWRHDGADGAAAVADFDGDGLPEVVVAGDGRVTLLDGDGSRVWQTDLPGGTGSGAPTVGDLDGDGEPEVGVGSRQAYQVLDTDGTTLWSAPTRDNTEGTSASFFDFEGDGTSEVIYADEETLWVLSGPDGSVRLELTEHASATLHEYPVVADVDRDGSAEIVLASNDYWLAGWRGIAVLGDRQGSWARARPIWNQHAYHVTHVEDDGGIPLLQPESWLAGNSFRAVDPEPPEIVLLADLAPGEPSWCLDECEEESALLWVPVENRGLEDAGDFVVQLLVEVDGYAVPVEEEIVAGLPAGEVVVLGPFALDEALHGRGSLRVVLDAGESVEECDHADNELDLGDWPCR